MAIICTIDAAGITAPTLADIRAYLVEKYKGIYGADVYLDPDSQDGEFIDLLATSIHDANAMAVAVYNAFSPSTAQGEGLSRVVKINGIARHVASYSTVDLLLGGTAGTVITNGIASDENGVRWMLPETVTIPLAGQITVTATASTIGDIAAATGTITQISTPTRGWQTVTNLLPATEGNPVETDAALRRRQAKSTQIPDTSSLAGIIGAVAAIPGVVRYAGLDNSEGGADENGIPGHSISIVVDGGAAATIAATILAKKGSGVATYGTTSEIVTDGFGVPRRISFMRPTPVPIAVDVSIRALKGYTSNVGAKVKSAVAAWVNALAIGEDVLLSKLYGPANLTGADGATFDITDLRISRDGAVTTAETVVVAYNEAATCLADDITIIVP